MASIRKRNKLWQVQVRSKEFGSTSKSFSLKSDAQKWANQQERSIQTGTFPRQAQLQMTIAGLLDRYRALVTPQKKAYGSEDRRISRLLRDPISRLPILSITPATVAEFRDRRMIDGLRTASYDLVILRHAWNIAIKEWGWEIGRNPFQSVRLPKAAPGRERRLRDGEFTILELTAQDRVWYLRPLIILAIETAMRKSELLSLEWKDLDTDNNWIVLRKTKNGESRTIPLSKRAKTELLNLDRKAVRVFPITDTAVRQAWDRLRLACGITDLNFHDLRHEAISRLFERGLSVPEVSLISGHKTMGQLSRYTHLQMANIVDFHFKDKIND